MRKQWAAAGSVASEGGTFSRDSRIRCEYAMFSRHGGAGGGLYESLNVGALVGDHPEIVAENRSRVRQAMGLAALLTARQVHGADIYRLQQPLHGDMEVSGVDALITDLAEVGLTVQQADCQAVLLYDPARPAIAAIHCGWRGSVAGIIGRVVTAMGEAYGSDPSLLRAVISPSLGPCCAEFVNYRHELPEEFLPFRVGEDHFDFWRISAMQLQQAGLQPGHVEVVGRCTCCSDDYFSHRRATRTGLASTGRNCSVIALRAGD